MSQERMDPGVPIDEALARRWSPRAFLEREVEPDKVRTLFEAARWAPSCFNEQPWRFLVAARGAEGHDGLVACLSEGNRKWAARAPVLGLSVASLRFARNDKPNRHAYHDVGLAMENLVVQATHIGLHVHQMAGFDAERARGDLGLPDGCDPVAMFALGYVADPSTLPGDLEERERRPRTRHPVGEFLYGARWGSPSPFLERD